MSTTDSQRGPARDVDSQEAARRESIEVNERRVVRMREAMTYYRDKMHEAMANRRTDEGDCRCDIPITDARRPTHCHLCGKKKLPRGCIPDAPEERAEIVSLQKRNEEWRKANQDASNWRHCETERADKAERQLAKMRKDRDEQWQAKIRERERIVSFVARIKDLESQVAELELTGDRVELQSLLDSCGLDFERMRERALTAERQLAYARKEIECLKRLCEELRLERDKARE